MLHEKTTSLEIKKRNRNRLYNLIRSKNSQTRQNLVHQLQLCLPTVVQNLTELQQEGLLQEIGSVGNTGGRRAKIYSVVEDAKTAIGLDITKRHISIVSLNLNGKIINKERFLIDFEMSDSYYRRLGDLIKDFVEKFCTDTSKILGIGLSLPALITEDRQSVYYGKILDCTGLSCEELTRYIPYPCALFHDADAAGFAEAWVDRNIQNAFYISLSNNIGGSVLMDRKIYNGEGARSGEIGHITIIPNGEKCYCGHQGCFETCCSASVLSDYTNGDLEEFFNQLNSGNFEDVWQEYLDYLSIAVNNVRMLFDCKVILGGYVGAYMENHIETLRNLVANRNPFEPNGTYLQVCHYKTESIAAGAAIHFIDEFVKNV